MAEFSITATCTVTDPAERQRRLAQVYGLLLELARRKREAGKANSGATAFPGDNGDGSAGSISE